MALSGALLLATLPQQIATVAFEVGWHTVRLTLALGTCPKAAPDLTAIAYCRPVGSCLFLGL